MLPVVYPDDRSLGPAPAPAAAPDFEAPAAAPPRQGWLLGRPPVMAPAMAPGPGPSHGTGGASSGEYTPRSADELQRAYDSAQGPPSKLAPAAGAPSRAAAPSGGAGPRSPGRPAAPAAGEEDLPAVPRAAAPPAAPPASQDSEFDELQRRFEALKRGDL
jgi:hypothetical protein